MLQTHGFHGESDLPMSMSVVTAAPDLQTRPELGH